MKDFWLAAGHHLLDRSDGGGLVVTDEFLKAYLARPELVPPPEACDAERDLHAALIADPRRRVSAAEIAAIADPDACENWALMLAFRDRLLAHPTLEAAYLALTRGEAGGTPPLFLNQLVQLILRNALDGCEDPFLLRAAELLFRPQRATSQDGAVLLADAETVELHENGRASSPLLEMFGGSAATELDVLDDDNARHYFHRSDAFDLVLNLGATRAREAIAAVLETWVRHLLGVRVTVAPLSEIRDQDWTWFVGLDAEGTRIGNALWTAAEPGPALERVLALFRLSFEDAGDALPAVAGKPVYLILAMTADRLVRIKPQNLIVGLPLGAAMTAS